MLRLQKLWTGLSVVLLVVSLWFALKPITPDEESWLDWLSFLTASDKVVHAEAFFGLGLWFGSLAGPSHWRRVGLLLLLYGALIEILQGAMALGRTADLRDLVADAGGLVLGLLAALWFGRIWLLRVDGWAASRGS
jgi:VanZ family protein